MTRAQAMAADIVERGRIPGCYAYDRDGWLHCRGCASAAMYPGEVPQHADGCPVADLERTGPKGAKT